MHKFNKLRAKIRKISMMGRKNAKIKELRKIKKPKP
jgi:hypothetical protein